MRVLFTASVFQREELSTYYHRIYDFLKGQGHNIVDNKILEVSLTDIFKQTKEENTNYLGHLEKWISESDVIVVEASFPSTINIGYEVSLALQRNKQVICLYKKGRRSSLFPVINPDKLIYEEYTDENLESVLKDCLDFVDTKSDVRFNFYLPSKAVAYIDKQSKAKHLSRSAILRQIIAEKMDEQT